MDEIEIIETETESGELIYGTEDAVTTIEDPVLSDDPEAGYDSYEAAQVVEVEVPVEQTSDVSFNVALLFVVSMILGVLCFSIFSRRWHV